MNTFKKINHMVQRFEELLNSRGITIRVNSELEHGCLILSNFYDEHLRAISGEFIPTTPEFRGDLQVALEVMNFMELILYHSKHPDFKQLIPHLELLSYGSPAQTIPFFC